MSNHRSLVVTVAAVLVGAGLLAPWWPVYLGQYDRYGVQLPEGLLRRMPDPEDFRRQVISLTAEGRHRAESDRKARTEWLARAMQERHSARERQVILDALSLLDRLLEHD